MKKIYKFAGLVSISALTLSLAACGATEVNHAAAACDSYDSVVEATNGTDIDAIVASNAALAATLTVWQTEGGEPADLYDTLSGYAESLEGFLLTNGGEEAQVYTEYVASETANIESMCSEARG